MMVNPINIARYTNVNHIYLDIVTCPPQKSKISGIHLINSPGPRTTYTPLASCDNFAPQLWDILCVLLALFARTAHATTQHLPPLALRPALPCLRSAPYPRAFFVTSHPPACAPHPRACARRPSSRSLRRLAVAVWVFGFVGVSW